MSDRWRSVLWTLVVAGGIAAGIASLFFFRLEDWPIYVTFLIVYLLVYLPAVEVLPGMQLPIPNMAVAIGFLYVGGLPILILRGIVPPLAQPLIRVLPEPWGRRFAEQTGHEAVRSLWDVVRSFWGAWAIHTRGSGMTIPAGERGRFWDNWAMGGRRADAGIAAEWALFGIGLATRWAIVCALVPEGSPTENLWVIGIAELGGYAVWGLLSVLPIYPDRPLLPLETDPKGLRSALADVGLVISMALAPFVFLIAYGYRSAGLPGAAAWSLATLGLHFMLKRLSERRLTVEDQNRRLERLHRELEHRERLSAIGKMSSVVSHQILHQLGVIGLYTDLLKNSGDEGAEAVREKARAIEDALGDVNRVLTDLLVFSKDLRLNLYRHPLKPLLEECLGDVRPDADKAHVILHLSCPESVEINVDKLKLKQAVLNVLRNAIAVSPNGSNVGVLVELREDLVDLAVSDQGPGVPEHEREAIFAPFFTTTANGTGLGLAIAREFVEAHRGTIRVENGKDGKGARFVIRLPVTFNESVPAGSSQGSRN